MSHPFHDVIDACGQIDLFVDVGPATAMSEAWYVRHKFPNCPIIGFEPAPAQRYELYKAGYPGTLYPFAVGETHKWSYIHRLGPDNSGMIFDRDKVPPIQRTHVNVVTLWDFLEPFRMATDGVPQENINSVLWADVEGSEINVLKGCDALVYNRWFSAIVLEVRDVVDGDMASDDWPTADKVLKYLEQFGYKVSAEFTRDSDCNSRDIVARRA